MTDADGRRTTYSYNADGDQTGETWVGSSPSEIITYTYDADNEITGASDSFATLTFTYTGDGQVQTAGTTGPGSGQPSVLLSYTYDPAGSKTSITDNLASAGITTYSYNAGEEVTAVATSYGGTAGPKVAFQLRFGWPADLGGPHDRRQRRLGQHNVFDTTRPTGKRRSRIPCTSRWAAAAARPRRSRPMSTATTTPTA